MVWQGLKEHLMAISFALPCASLLAIELRDLGQRARWDVKPLPPHRFHTGDLILVCNRWFTLPGAHKWYSAVCKVVMKTSWDGCGVIIQDGGAPQILFLDYDTVKLQPLAEFIEERKPRGVAVRSLDFTRSKSTNSQATAMAKKLMTETVTPWRALTAGFRVPADEESYFKLAIERANEELRLERMLGEVHTKEVMVKQRKIIEELKVQCEESKKQLHSRSEGWGLHPASVVTKFLVGLDLLPPDWPDPSAYVVADLASSIPLRQARMEDPRVIART